MGNRGPDHDLELMRFHDGELPPEARRHVEGRLAPADREQLAWLAALGSALRHGGPFSAPAKLASRVMAAIRDAAAVEHPLISLTPYMRRLATAAAALLVIALAATYLRGRSGAAEGDDVGWRKLERPDPLERSTGERRFFRPDPTVLYR